MEESSRFLSLSGLSGVFAGFLAIMGGCIAHFFILNNGNIFIPESLINLPEKEILSMKIQLFADAIIVLVLALTGSFCFSLRKSRQKNQKIWTPVSRRMLTSLIIPLIAGAFFISIFILDNQFQYIVSAMLIFYGLALISAGKFTFSEVFYLGLAELLTGFASAVFHESSVLFWIIGFGFLNILYGLFMYRKYER